MYPFSSLKPVKPVKHWNTVESEWNLKSQSRPRKLLKGWIIDFSLKIIPITSSPAHISPNIINVVAQDKEEPKVVGEDLSSSGDRKRQGTVSPNERKVSINSANSANSTNSTNSERKANSSFWKTYPGNFKWVFDWKGTFLKTFFFLL